jgi:isopenicillin N synthase-like dioxygenase
MKWFVFILIVLAIIGIAAYGYSHNWYSLTKETDDHKTKIDITIDQDKIQEDKEKAKKKAEELENKAKEKVGETGDKGKKDAPKP